MEGSSEQMSQEVAASLIRLAEKRVGMSMPGGLAIKVNPDDYTVQMETWREMGGNSNANVVQTTTYDLYENEEGELAFCEGVIGGEMEEDKETFAALERGRVEEVFEGAKAEVDQ